mmetsp:Transcript_38529/g.92584  ORF Transcript_38529/g.92584 Transcript_38529/m.92584 type:complete len:296 (-) Transcript_38529:563-1450(-)
MVPLQIGNQQAESLLAGRATRRVRLPDGAGSLADPTVTVRTVDLGKPFNLFLLRRQASAELVLGICYLCELRLQFCGHARHVSLQLSDLQIAVRDKPFELGLLGVQLPKLPFSLRARSDSDCQEMRIQNLLCPRPTTLAGLQLLRQPADILCGHRGLLHSLGAGHSSRRKLLLCPLLRSRRRACCLLYCLELRQHLSKTQFRVLVVPDSNLGHAVRLLGFSRSALLVHLTFLQRILRGGKLLPQVRELRLHCGSLGFHVAQNLSNASCVRCCLCSALVGHRSVRLSLMQLVLHLL